MSGKIVVGVDASPGSVRALRWAYEEAALRRMSVEIVNVWHYPYTGGMAVYAIPEKEFELGAQQVVHRTLDEAGPSPEGVTVDTLIVRGGAAQCLLELAGAADLLVVGSRGHGGFAGLLLGSVSQQCAHHSPCPVVVVPPGEPPGDK
jgi:nucleotide-binding universal stress UspA family protein